MRMDFENSKNQNPRIQGEKKSIGIYAYNVLVNI